MSRLSSFQRQKQGYQTAKQIVVRFYSATNLGDDLFIHILAERYKNTFYINRTPKVKTFKKYDNIKASAGFLRHNFLRVKQRIGNHLPVLKNNQQVPILTKQDYKNGNLLLYVGGSIFMEKSPLQKWRNERDQYLSLKIPYYILGSNFGPYKTQEFKQIVKDIISNSVDTCFRDLASYREFNNVKSARVSTDIVFTLKFKENLRKSKTAVFSIIDTYPRFDQIASSRYESLMLLLMEKLISEGYSVKLMSFCRKEGDEKAIERISNQVPASMKDSVSSYLYTGDLQSALETLNDAEIIVASRFHSVILGFLFGAKTLPVAYSDKTLNILEDLEYNGLLIDIRQIEKFASESFSFSDLEGHNVDKFREMAQTQFSKLDEILEKK